ncbi:hypothetical protein [Phormidesmis priestleyi]
MRFQYLTTSSTQNEFDSLPRLSLLLLREAQRVEAVGLVDSGAAVNVLPYELGLQLGGIWDDRRAIIQLTGNLSSRTAIPFSTIAQVGEFPQTQLIFAWVKRPNTPLILGQTNFFLEFDVCFYRSKLEFEVKLKS